MSAAFAALLADAWGMHGNVGWGWMIGMMFFMVLFWAAVILGIVWLVRGWGRPRRETPTEILERRFAEGAISADDYYRRRKIIDNGTHRYNGEASSSEASQETFIGQAT